MSVSGGSHSQWPFLPLYERKIRAVQHIRCSIVLPINDRVPPLCLTPMFVHTPRSHRVQRSGVVKTCVYSVQRQRLRFASSLLLYYYCGSRQRCLVSYANRFRVLEPLVLQHFSYLSNIWIPISLDCSTPLVSVIYGHVGTFFDKFLVNGAKDAMNTLITDHSTSSEDVLS